MNKLKKKGAKSSLSSINKSNTEASPSTAVKKERITTVGRRTDTTYKVSPLSIRLSESDKKELSDWVDELNEMTEKNRKANPAKLIRALLETKKEAEALEAETKVDKTPIPELVKIFKAFEQELVKAINAQ